MNAEMRLLNLIDREANKERIVKATFELHAEDAEFLRGKTGKRFGAALVEIGDDEKPVPEKKRTNHQVLRAGMLCQDINFHQYLKYEYPFAWDSAIASTPDARAAIVVRELCEIGSRADLATNEKAAQAFDGIIARYEMWKRGE